VHKSKEQNNKGKPEPNNFLSENRVKEYNYCCRFNQESEGDDGLKNSYTYEQIIKHNKNLDKEC
jgi:hypothetical protein